MIFDSSSSGNSGACKTWCSLNPAKCDALKKNHCNSIENIGSAACKAFARQTASKLDSTFDPIVDAYCTLNKDDPFCSCRIRSTFDATDESLLKLLNAPQCYDPECISNGYENTKQVSFRKDGSCPKSICSNKINVADVSFSNVSSIVASCSSGSSNDTKNETAIQHPPTSGISKNTIVIWLFFLMVVLLAYIVTGDSKPKDSKFDNIRTNEDQTL